MPYSVTVPGSGGYGSGHPGHSPVNPDQIALYIAIECEVDLYRKHRAACHRHNRLDDEHSSHEVDKLAKELYEAQLARDDREIKVNQRGLVE